MASNGSSKRRERQYSWVDPMAVRGKHFELSGLEFLRALASGELEHSPIAHTLGFRVTEAKEGSATIELEPAEFLYNAVGSVHGGAVTAIADSAMGFAVSTTLPASVGYTTLDLNIRFLRPVTEETGTIRATGYAEHSGRTTATARAEIRDSDDRLLASATARCMILRPESS
ncbi:PaaI family thioesterase [Hoyosella subflava]|nr:PaaI family thioesterase [Hoyosella subflava]